MMEATCYNALPEPLWDDIFLFVRIDKWYLRRLSTFVGWHLPIRRFKELPLSALRTTLGSLKFAYVKDQSDVDGDLEIIADLFPYLEELEFSWSYEFTHNGVAMLSSKLKRLRKVSFVGNVSITDASIRSLVENCVDLEEIALNQCRYVTQEGVLFAFGHCQNLKSLVLQNMGDIGNGGPLALARNVTSLEFSSMIVSYDLLSTISRANIPLRRFSVSRCNSLSVGGITLLLEAYQSLLEYFAIENLDDINQLEGHTVIHLAPYLWNVRTVKLSFCCQLSTKQLLMLVNICCLLTDLEIKGNQISQDQGPYSLFCDRKFQLRSLNLSYNKMITDQCLAKVSRTCPYLLQLFVKDCTAITHKGCTGVSTLGLDDIRVSKLEMLEARGSSLDNNSLNLIALKCPDLMCLDVSNCSYLFSSLGVRDVVMNCKNLCKLGVSFNFIDPDLKHWVRSKKPWLVNRYV